jgi:hypothetical protein
LLGEKFRLGALPYRPAKLNQIATGLHLREKLIARQVLRSKIASMTVELRSFSCLSFTVGTVLMPPREMLQETGIDATHFRAQQLAACCLAGQTGASLRPQQVFTHGS